MKVSASFPKLTSEESCLPSMSAQADGFPKGWTIRRVPSSNNSGIAENIYYSKSNLRFCGIAEARRFLDCLNETGGNDEEAACQLFQNEMKPGGKSCANGNVRTQGDVQTSIKVKTEYDQYGASSSNTNNVAASPTTAITAVNKSAEKKGKNHTKVKEERKQQQSQHKQDDKSINSTATSTDRQNQLPVPPYSIETHIKFEADTETVYDSDVKVIDDESGDNVRGDQKMELVDLTSDYVDVLRGGQVDDTNAGRQKKDDKKHEKLIKLTPDQAEETKYPQGCEVIYRYKHDTSSNSTLISIGVVLSVNVSLKGDFVYELQNSSASKNKEGKVLMVDESSLAYAPRSPVFFQPDPSHASRKEGTVLLVKRSANDEPVRYSVLTLSGEGEHTIQHNVAHDQLSFRSVPTDLSSSTKSPPTMQPTTEDKDESIENALKTEKDGANATRDTPGQVVDNQKDNEDVAGILAETEDAEMLSVLGEQQFHERNIRQIQSLVGSKKLAAAVESQAHAKADGKDIKNNIKAKGDSSGKKTKKRRKDEPSRTDQGQGMTEAQRIFSEQFMPDPKRKRSSSKKRTLESTPPPGAKNNRGSNGGRGKPSTSAGQHREARNQPKYAQQKSKETPHLMDQHARKQRSSYGDITPKHSSSAGKPRNNQSQRHIRFG